MATAGRPEKNTVEYYPHKIGRGKKISYIEKKYQALGYTTWHKILEQMCITPYHYLNLNQEEMVMHLASISFVEEEMLFDIINDLARLGVFDKNLWEHRIIWSQCFIDSIQYVYEKRKNECIDIIGLYTLLHHLRVLKPDILPPKVYGNTGTKQNSTELKSGTQTVLEIWPFFNDFWELYDKKVGKDNAEKKWHKLNQEQKEAIIIHVTKYKIAQPNKTYRKDPCTYLNNKSWLDEIIIKTNANEQSNNQTRSTGFNPAHANQFG